MVSNTKLQSIIDEIYKAQGKKGQIGNGTTMDAIMNERKTGKATKDSFHSKKARNAIRALDNIRDRKMTIYDKKIIRALRESLRKALITPLEGDK